MDEKLKESYERLGVDETVTNEELNARLDRVLKRRRSLTGEQEIAAYESEFQAIKLILDTRDKREVEAAEQERLAKYGSFAGTAGKWEKFMRLHKTHVLISVIVLIVLIVAGNLLYNNWQHRKYLASLPPRDAKIMIVGNFGVDDKDGETNDLAQAMIDQYPQWKRVDILLSYLPSTDGTRDTLDPNFMQKAMVEIAANHPDMLILDEATYQWIGSQPGFDSLEPLVAEGAITKDDPRLRKITIEETGKEEINAIEINDSPIYQALPLKSATEPVMIGVLTGEEGEAKMLDFVKHLADLK